MATRHARALTLLEVVVIVLFIGVVLLMIPAIYTGTRHSSLKSDCKSSLKQLGNYLTLYVVRYGSDRDYPIPVVLGGSGAPVPAGPNGAFWSWLYRNPSQTNAVSKRPGDDGIYLCRQHGSMPTTTALDYTGPRLAAVWPIGPDGKGGGPVFPGGILSEAVRGDAPIGGDILGPPDLPNHGGTAAGAPNEDWNALMFDGHVESIIPGSDKHTLYALTTVGVRST